MGFLARISWTSYGVRNTVGKVILALAFSTSPSSASETITIAALGDSLTQGFGLVVEDGFVPQLQSWLIAQGQDVQLINAGVSGDTTAGGLARIDWTLNDDVDGVIVALGGNDFLRGLDPATSRANLEGILAKAIAKDVGVLLVAMTAPGNFGPDYKSAFDQIYPDLAQKYDVQLAPAFLAPIAAALEDGAAVNTYLQPDGLHPNSDGVKLIVEGLGPSIMSFTEQLQ